MVQDFITCSHPNCCVRDSDIYRIVPDSEMMSKDPHATYVKEKQMNNNIHVGSDVSSEQVSFSLNLIKVFVIKKKCMCQFELDIKSLILAVCRRSTSLY